MNLFKKIWNAVTGLFSNRQINDENVDKIIGKIRQKPNNKGEVVEIIQSIDDKESKAKIIEMIDQFEREIKILDGKREKISLQLTEIKQIEHTDNGKVIVESLNKINQLIETKTILSIPHLILKDSHNLDKLLKYNNLLTQFREREVIRKKKEELHIKQIQERLRQIKKLIVNGNLEESKLLIAQIKKEIKSTYHHEIKQINELHQKVKEKELQILKRKQEEAQRRRDEEATRLREIEDRRLEELRKQREQEEKEQRERDAKRREIEEKHKREKQALKELLVKKSNWYEFQQVLEQNGITKLYHFTDKANIKSIKEHGGLYSWHYCDRHNIQIPRSGGSSGSRYNDRVNGKIDFVRVAFTKEHPMCVVAQNDGRIQDVVWLEINPEVAFFTGSEFADKNAAAFTSYRAKIGKEIQYLKNVRFDILNKAKEIKHYRLNEDERPYNQAEVLVKTWIPIDYILNINNY